MTHRIVLVMRYPFNAFLMLQPALGFPSSDLSCKQLLWFLRMRRSDFVATRTQEEAAKFAAKACRKFLGAKWLRGTRFKRDHASQVAVVPLLSHADEPAVPANGGGADDGDGGAAQPTQVLA